MLYSSFIKFLYNEGHKSLFVSKFYLPKVKILYLHPDLKLGTIFAPHETLVLEMQFWVKFSIISVPSPYHILLYSPSFLNIQDPLDVNEEIEL